MSKIAFTPNASGTGTFTIASPDSNTNRTLTLPDADGALLAGAQAPFIPAAVSGATQTLDVGAANFFDAGTLTADTTVSFTNVPTEARWTYTADVQPAIAPDVENLIYRSLATVSTQTDEAKGLYFNGEGTRMFVLDNEFKKVLQYDLSTPWDVGTAGYNSVSLDVSSQETGLNELTFKPDGTKMYIIGTGNDRVFQYSLSTAWDLSTASYDSVSFSVASQEGAPSGLAFKDDGTKMYVVGYNTSTVYVYSLSTAWNVSTASYDSVSLNLSSQLTGVESLSFADDGATLVVLGNRITGFLTYSLLTPWDVSTASYLVTSGELPSINTFNTASFFLKPDQTRLFVSANFSTTGRVYQYDAFSLPAITFPVEVSLSSNTGRQTFSFFTTDGGTTVNAGAF